MITPHPLVTRPKNKTNYNDLPWVGLGFKSNYLLVLFLSPPLYADIEHVNVIDQVKERILIYLYDISSTFELDKL